MATRRELTRAIGDRYRNGSYSEKKVILTEFVAVTGYHRKHAIRVLLGAEKGIEPAGRARAIRRVYDEAVRQALVILWEASDRVCGKRLKSLLTILVEALERHGHLRLDSVVRAHVLKVSAATIDRLRKPAHSGVGQACGASAGYGTGSSSGASAHLRRLGCSAARLRRGGPGRALRHSCRGQFRSHAHTHRHCDRLD